MLFKRYIRGKYLGEDREFDWGILLNGKRYKGEFLVFSDCRYGEGCVLFCVNNKGTGTISGQADKWDWSFLSKDEVPQDVQLG